MITKNMITISLNYITLRFRTTSPSEISSLFPISCSKKGIYMLLIQLLVMR